jgi:hypothetical protein
LSRGIFEPEKIGGLPAKCCRSISTAEVTEIYEILSGLSGLRGKNRATTLKRKTVRK